MPINTATIVDTLDANLNSMFQDGLESWGEEYSKMFNVLNSTKQSELDSYESGFGLIPEKTEGAGAAYDILYPGIKKTYTHVTYALKQLLGVLKSNFEVIKKAVSVETLCIG